MWLTPARVALVLLLASVAGGGACRDAPPDRRTADELFAGTAIRRLDLVLDDAAVAALAADPRTYVRGEVRSEGTVWKHVGIRIKGHRSIQSWDGKPAFGLHFGKFKKKRRFFGLEKLALNNMVEDPSMLRETLAYRLHRAVGVPAPRTAYVQVAVNGRPFGLYLMIEPIDERFLAGHADDGTGNLYEGAYGCDLYEDDVSGFEQDGGEDESRADLASFAATAEGPADRLFAADGPLDLRRVLAYLAVSAFVGDFDGYRHGHNYRVYHDPVGDRWTFLPWGLDRTFRKHLGIYDSGGLIAKRCFADPSCRRDYVRSMREVLRVFETVDLPGELERTAALIDAAVRGDPRRPYSIKEVAAAQDKLRRYLGARVAEVRAGLGCLDDAGELELDRDGDGAGCMDSDDADPAVHPGAAEACDRRDNDGNGLVDDAAACACPAVVVDGVTFHLCDLPMTWAEADAFCAAQGTTLARFDDLAQTRAIGSATRDARKRSKKSKWWIGLSDRAAENDFGWRDGTPLGFTRWSKGEPDNDACNQDCVALGDRGTGKWHDTHCASRLPFVCR